MAATKTKWKKWNRLTVLFPVKLSCSLQQQQQNPPPPPPRPPHTLKKRNRPFKLTKTCQ